MKIKAIYLLLLILLILVACEDSPDEHDFQFKGETENWSVTITGVYSPRGEDVYENADATFTYKGEEDIRSIVISTYTTGNRAKVSKEFDHLSSKETVESNYGNYRFWLLNEQGHDILVDFKWREGERNTKQEETVKLDFEEL
ncbi:hypothetical protein [Alkalibacillus almallahensis]|uniref:hypothetical protein n=1 Tax=Alkalibacillus almallahensis TaxID=1379154 RepID=UPI0014245275|nr:hypothetical protein [Alkalibacillus almallahensis]NIK11751.1 hypothetical protein [Alkalibacillus almallahensis]